MADINKALVVKKITDPRTKLLSYFHEFLDVFDYIKVNRLPPLRGKGVDHEIKLLRENGKDIKVL